MNRAIILLLIGLTAVSNASNSSWEEFKKTYGKKYNSPREELYRKSIFEKNLLQVIKHNQLYQAGMKSYSKGINELADKTLSELVTKIKLESPSETSFIYQTSNSIDLPASKDWRSVEGVVSEVKNQGQCGSCWAFSATGSLEGQMKLKKNKQVSLSEQQLVDCSRNFGNEGCNGGLMISAFKYIRAVGGIESENDYEYHAHDERCKFDKSKVVAEVSDFKTIPYGDESTLKSVVANQGPVSVGIDATYNFQFYRRGILVDEDCNTSALNHGVLVVGYGTDEEKGLDYWIVKNSWGSRWGEHGFLRMARNKSNMCGIATQASIPTV